MKNHCIPYFGGKEITKTKYYMMKSYNKYVSMLFAVLLVSSAWAAEVSDSLKTLNTIGQATTYVYNYPSKNAAGEDVVLSSALVAWLPEEPK